MAKKSVDEKSQLKNILLICSTLIALASFGLNIAQYNSNQQLKAFETRRSFPSVHSFRIKLSPENIEKVRELAQEGVDFSYLVNPSFYDVDKLKNIDDNVIVEFLVIVNNGDVALSNLRFAARNPNDKPSMASFLAPHSTLLIPEILYKDQDNIEYISDVTQVIYDFQIGGNKETAKIEISDQSEDVIIFEVGLGEISQSAFDFGE